MSPNEAGRRNRVAVVAIHGVGDHPQFQTAREIGDLLLDLDEKDCEPRYVPFKERTLRLNVRPGSRPGHDSREFHQTLHRYRGPQVHGAAVGRLQG
jgi:hypothetical protein